MLTVDRDNDDSACDQVATIEGVGQPLARPTRAPVEAPAVDPEHHRERGRRRGGARLPPDVQEQAVLVAAQGRALEALAPIPTPGNVCVTKWTPRQ